LAHHLAVKVVGGAKPFLEVVVDLIGARDLDAVGDAVFFGEAAGVDESLRQPAAIRREAKSEIDSRVGRGLNLSEDMIPVKRDHRLAGAGLDVRAKSFAESKKLLEDWPHCRFAT
jgi:hypothetical protein